MLLFIVRLVYFSVIDVLYVSLQYFDTVGWVFWPVKNRLPYNLYCVGWDVKHCSIHLLMGSGMSGLSVARQPRKPSVSTDPSVLTEDNTTGLPSKFNLLDWSMNPTTSIRRQVLTSWTQLHATHWALIRHLAMTVSYVCLKLVCFQSTSTYSALEISDYYAL